MNTKRFWCSSSIGCPVLVTPHFAFIFRFSLKKWLYISRILTNVCTVIWRYWKSGRQDVRSSLTTYRAMLKLMKKDALERSFRFSRLDELFYIIEGRQNIFIIIMNFLSGEGKIYNAVIESKMMAWAPRFPGPGFWTNLLTFVKWMSSVSYIHPLDSQCCLDRELPSSPLINLYFTRVYRARADCQVSCLTKGEPCCQWNLLLYLEQWIWVCTLLAIVCKYFGGSLIQASKLILCLKINDRAQYCLFHIENSGNISNILCNQNTFIRYLASLKTWCLLSWQIFCTKYGSLINLPNIYTWRASNQACLIL